MQVETISLIPRSGTSRVNGACLMATIEVFVPCVGITLRNMELTYDAAGGWSVHPARAAKGIRAYSIAGGSEVARSAAISASRAYLKLSERDLDDLRQLNKMVA